MPIFIASICHCSEYESIDTAIYLFEWIRIFDLLQICGISRGLRGFLGEINKSVIKEDYKTKLKNEYLGEINAEALGASQDDDIRLSIYRSLKSIYDKWISASPAGKNKKENKLFYNPIGKDRILMDHFSFVNRVNEDIGDKALVNIYNINELFLNTTNSIYGVTSDILDSSNFNFFPLPSYVDLSAGVSLFTKTNVKPNNRQQAVEDMFRPISTQERFSRLPRLCGSYRRRCIQTRRCS